MTNETGNRIKNLRLSRGMTQQQIADLVDTKSYTTISHWESGKNSPSGKDLMILSEYFKVSTDSILGLEQLHIPENQEFEYDFYPVSVAAGLLSSIEGITEDSIEKITLPDSLMGKHAGDSDIFLMRVNGDSMNKVIPHESMIAVKKVNLDALCDNDVVVFSNENEYSVKRYFNDKVRKEYVFGAESTDRSFRDHFIPYEEADNLAIHGKVVLYIVSTD